MRSIVLTGAICFVIASCGNRKASSDNVVSNRLAGQVQIDSLTQSENLFDGDPK